MHVIMCCNLTLHIAGSLNTAADSPSRLERKVTEKVRLKNREDIQTTPIEVTTSSSYVADGEQLFFTQADNKDELEEQTLERRERSRQNAKQWAANEGPCHVNVHSAGSLCELLPQLVNQLIGAAQSQHLNQ